MSRAFVLGNGRSRLAINPNELKKLGTVYACNAAYRDFTPDFLVSVDVKMVLELAEKRVQYTTNVWCNYKKEFEKLQGFNYFDPSTGWSSGPSALFLASKHGYKEIYILGFDFQGLENHTKVNNVYTDTPNYKTSNEMPTFYGNWLHQTEKVIKDNPDTKYFRINDHTQFKPVCENLKNLEHLTYDMLKSMMNCQNS